MKHDEAAYIAFISGVLYVHMIACIVSAQVVFHLALVYSPAIIHINIVCFKDDFKLFVIQHQCSQQNCFIRVRNTQQSTAVTPELGRESRTNDCESSVLGIRPTGVVLNSS